LTKAERYSRRMNVFKLSERLQNVAALIKKGNIVADIGTDHAYLPIHIVNSGISDRVIAMDVRKGPLEKAKQNVSDYKTAGNISIRLSDGLDLLCPMEAETITICGMGGRLIKSILESGKDKYNSQTQLILSPQSELREFRQYLYSFGYSVQKEVILKEDSQFYFIFCCFRDGQTDYDRLFCRKDDVYKEMVLRYGIELLREKNECLKEYLEREYRLTKQVYETVDFAVKNRTEKANGSAVYNEESAVNIAETENVEAGDAQKGGATLKARLEELKFDIKCIERALEFYK